LPLAGTWDSGNYLYVGIYNYLRSATQYDSTNARARYISQDNAWIYPYYQNKTTRGFSVRCIKD
jgi:hypothetical protein